MSPRELPTAAIIGAGSSGIAAAKQLNDAGIPFDCFEKSDRVGGNWAFGNRNGMSSAYRSLHMHAHHYVDNANMRDKNVVVLGMGNSAMDIAVEASQVASKVFLAARRGAHVIPKYLFGRPLDQMGLSPRVPWPVRQKILEGIIKTTTGSMERYGLPKPDHRIGEAH